MNEVKNKVFSHVIFGAIGCYMSLGTRRRLVMEGEISEKNFCLSFLNVDISPDKRTYLLPPSFGKIILR